MSAKSASNLQATQQNLKAETQESDGDCPVDRMILKTACPSSRVPKMQKYKVEKLNILKFTNTNKKKVYIACILS